MEYKKLLKNRNTRLKLLRLFDWVPDEMMLKLQYYIKMGRRLNLDNPKRFSEKLQWYKLYYKDDIMAICADKYDVRGFVRERGYENILIDCLGVYESVDSLQFESFPNEFVLKDTLGSGGDSVIIVNKKLGFNEIAIKQKCQEWLDNGLVKVDPGREWVYCQQKHRIIVEKKLEKDRSCNDLLDYKFFCFNGKCRFIYVIGERTLGNGAGLAVLTNDFEKLDVLRTDERKLNMNIVKPENYEEMLRIAESLSMGFPEVRVDLYNTNGKIYFGEMTFYDGSGYMKYDPDEFDFTAGDYFILPSKRE